MKTDKHYFYLWLLFIPAIWDAVPLERGVGQCYYSLSHLTVCQFSVIHTSKLKLCFLMSLEGTEPPFVHSTLEWKYLYLFLLWLFLVLLFKHHNIQTQRQNKIYTTCLAKFFQYYGSFKKITFTQTTKGWHWGQYY